VSFALLLASTEADKTSMQLRKMIFFMFKKLDMN